MIIYCKLIIQAILNKNIEFTQTFLLPQEFRPGRESLITEFWVWLLWAPYCKIFHKPEDPKIFYEGCCCHSLHRWRNLILRGVKWQIHDNPMPQEKYLDQITFPQASSPPCCSSCTDQGLLNVLSRFLRSVSHSTVVVHACNYLPYWFMLKRTQCSAVMLEKFLSTYFFLACLRTQNCSQSDWLLEAIGKQHEAFSFWIKLSTCPNGCWKFKCAILSITIENTKAITWDDCVLSTDHPRMP